MSLLRTASCDLHVPAEKIRVTGNMKYDMQLPEAMLSFFSNQLATPSMDASVRADLTSYLRATGAWTGSDAQLQAKAPGLVHLIAGSAEYQFV